MFVIEILYLTAIYTNGKIRYKIKLCIFVHMTAAVMAVDIGRTIQIVIRTSLQQHKK